MLPLQRFKSFVSDNQLFSDTARVLLAVSSGKDSVLMAHLFNAAGLSFGIAHCNFRLRGPESDADEAFAEDLAKRFGVPYYVAGFDTETYAAEKKISIQMAARELRYNWFETIRNDFGYDAIALAHHQSDVIETVLLNLVRGTGISGLHGILPKRDKLIRPLLFLTREEIDHIVAAENIPYREDSSNSSNKYARNKLRLDVIPKLKELNPQLEQTFEANSSRFTELEEFLELNISALRNQLLSPQPDGSFKITVSELEKLRPQKLLLFELFRPFGFSEQVLADLALSYRKHAGRVFESPSHQLLLDREVLILSAKKAQSLVQIEVKEDESEFVWNDIKFTKTLLVTQHTEINKLPAVAFTDADKLTYPLTVRNWQQGDVFQPIGMKGKKKLSDFFIGLKMPLNAKADIPLLINGNGEIIWVAGLRLDERYKISRQTKKVAIFGLDHH